MPVFDVDSMRTSLREHRVEWRLHVLQKLAERNIKQGEVIEVLLRGECIREYADDKPFPSALFLGVAHGRPLHVVTAFDEANFLTFIITAYQPSDDVFESDYRTRKKT